MRIVHSCKALMPSRAWSRFLHWPLALLFLYSGSVKLVQLPQFARAIGEFGIVWDRLVRPTAFVVCFIELGLACALFQQKSWSLMATGMLLVGFLGVLSYGIAIGLDIECGCLGSGYKLKLWQQHGIDLILLAWCACGHYLLNNKKGNYDA